MSDPSLDNFLALAKRPSAGGRRRLIPVVRRLFSDTLTPVLAYRRLVRDDPRMSPSFLFESVVGGERIGRYSYLGSRPSMQVIAREHEVKIYRTGADEPERLHRENPLKELARLTAAEEVVGEAVEGGFGGGWVGYAGYDTVRYLEPGKLPFTDAPPDDRGLPDLHMQFYRDVVVFDHVQKTVLAVTHAELDAEDDAENAYHEAKRRLEEMVSLLDHPGEHESERLPLGHLDLASQPPELPVSSLGEGGYQRAVETVKEYVRAGDAFQVVPSQRFELTTRADPFDLYRALRVVNPSPYMFYLQVEGAVLVGSSPEILCKVEAIPGAGIPDASAPKAGPQRRRENKKVTSRPLAGTRHRGASAEEDAALAAELLADPKDRAEHIMLVDLHRNDIGRVAVPGSIELRDVMSIERYSHVMHISSEVTGTLREDLDAWDALAVSLPVGTVSGAPKVRAMQIIDEVERTRRGPYGGAVGYADLSGNLDMAIALRTMVVLPGDKGHWTVHLQAGGGIVADSDPDAEHQETVNKAKALAKAVAVAEATLGPRR